MLTYYYWPVPAGGAENQCRKLAAALVSRGHVCTVLTSRHKVAGTRQEVEGSGVQIVRKLTLETAIQIFLKAGRNTDTQSQEKEQQHCHEGVITSVCRPTVKFRDGFARLAANGIRYGNIVVFALGVLFYLGKNRNSIDVLHVHTAEWIAGLAALAGKFFKIPVVCKGATMPVFPSLYSVPIASLFDIWRKKSYFIALTGAMQDDLVRSGVPSSRITVIPNGVTIPVQTVAVEQNEHFLYIGNLSQSVGEKGFDILIQAWAELHLLRPAAHLIFLGGGDAKPWKEYAENRGCGKSIEFAGYQQNIEPFLKSSRCLLLPSRKEGISNALLEAQSWGLPAIVSDIPGNKEVVVHDETGYIVAVGDADALSKAILIIVDSPELCSELGAEARKRIEEKFSMDMVAQQVIKLYHRLLV
jgi:glycosyltransferase involved in cell wall biosynthesis